MIESGLDGFEVTNWYCVFAPQGTPKDIIDKFNAELRKILSAPDLRDRLAKMGSAPVHGSPEEFARYIQAEVPRWAEVVKKAKARID